MKTLDARWVMPSSDQRPRRCSIGPMTRLAAPITFHVLFTFFVAPEPTAVQQDPTPLTSLLPARGSGAFPAATPWPAAEGARRQRAPAPPDQNRAARFSPR